MQNERLQGNQVDQDNSLPQVLKPLVVQDQERDLAKYLQQEQFLYLEKMKKKELISLAMR